MNNNIPTLIALSCVICSPSVSAEPNRWNELVLTNHSKSEKVTGEQIHIAWKFEERVISTKETSGGPPGERFSGSREIINWIDYRKAHWNWGKWRTGGKWLQHGASTGQKKIPRIELHNHGGSHRYKITVQFSREGVTIGEKVVEFNGSKDWNKSVHRIIHTKRLKDDRIEVYWTDTKGKNKSVIGHIDASLWPAG